MTKSKESKLISFFFVFFNAIWKFSSAHAYFYLLPKCLSRLSVLFKRLVLIFTVIVYTIALIGVRRNIFELENFCLLNTLEKICIKNWDSLDLECSKKSKILDFGDNLRQVLSIVFKNKKNFSGQLSTKSGVFAKCSLIFDPNSEVDIVKFNLKASYNNPENFVLLDREPINFTTR